MSSQEILIDFLASYTEGWGDWPTGEPITPDSIVAGFFNSDACIDVDGDVVFRGGNAATEEQTARLIDYLRANHHI